MTAPPTSPLLSLFAASDVGQLIDPSDPRLGHALDAATLAVVVSRADGVVVEEERAALRRLLSEVHQLTADSSQAVTEFCFGLDDRELPPLAEVAERLRDAQDLDRAALLDGLIAVGAADRTVHRAEAAALRAVAGALGADPESFLDRVQHQDPTGGLGTRQTRLGPGAVTIGQAPDNTVQLPGLTIARFHAMLLPRGADWVVQDLDTDAGTWLNGARIEEATLSPGDVVRVESHCLRFDPARGSLWVWDADESLTLTAQGLSVAVGRARRPILSDVSFTASAGELVAVLGPSGSGKTTLLSALLGVVPLSAGAVLLNGERCARLASEHAARCGFVPQDDLVHGQLTVRESLRYSAWLRSAPGQPRAALRRATERVLSHLGLEAIGDARIGDPVRRGISGGERKRVNLGGELLNPATRLLLFDEPTTGLDPHTSAEILELMRRLADEGRAVIFVTHHTDEQLFKLVDRALVLGVGGHQAWYGPPAQATRFFGVNTVPALYGQLRDPARAAAMAKRFRSSEHYARNVGVSPAPSPVPDSAFLNHSQGGLSARAIANAARTSLRQLAGLTHRAARVKWRDRSALLAGFGQVPLIVLGCWVALSQALVIEHPLRDGTLPVIPGALPFVLVLAAFWLGTVNAVREIVSDQAIYARERLAGVRLLPYLGSKLLVLGGLVSLQALLLIAATEVLFGLSARHLDLGAAAAMLVLTGWVGVAIGLGVSAFFRTNEAAVGVVPALVVPQLLFGGVLVPIDHLPAALRWLPNLVPARWGMDGLVQAGAAGIGPGGQTLLSACTLYTLPGDQAVCMTEYLGVLGLAARPEAWAPLQPVTTFADAVYALIGLTAACAALAAIILRARRG